MFVTRKVILQIKSTDIKLVDVESITPNPENNNRHSIEQIKRLEKGIKHNGFRVPLIVSNRSGFLISGHGRLTAAENLGLKQVPVIFQDFENEAEEYQFLTFDNEISRWAELDVQAVHLKLGELQDKGEDIDIDLLGLNFDLFKLDMVEEKEIEESQDQEKRFAIEVEFTNDIDMNEVKDELLFKGYMVKVK